MPQIPALCLKLVLCQWATFVSEASLYLQLQKLSINTTRGNDDLGQLQDLKSDITRVQQFTYDN